MKKLEHDAPEKQCAGLATWAGATGETETAAAVARDPEAARWHPGAEATAGLGWAPGGPQTAAAVLVAAAERHAPGPPPCGKAPPRGGAVPK